MGFGRGVVAGIALALALSAVPAAAAAGTVNPFCGQPVLRDFTAPLDGLPPVTEPPESGMLPFAPEGVVLNAGGPSERHLVLVGYHPYYALDKITAPSVRLGWSVKVTVSRIENGVTSPIAPEATTVIGDLGPAQSTQVIAAAAPSEAGSYRVDMTFLDESGHLLGSYAGYLQAQDPRFEARLGIDRRKIKPGGKLRVRIENLGTTMIGYGYPYGLQRRKRGSWIAVPTGPFLLPLLGLPAGEAGECQVIRLAPNAPPGPYRISKSVSGFPGPVGPERAVVRARFRVSSVTARP